MLPPLLAVTLLPLLLLQCFVVPVAALSAAVEYLLLAPGMIGSTAIVNT